MDQQQTQADGSPTGAAAGVGGETTQPAASAGVPSAPQNAGANNGAQENKPTKQPRTITEDEFKAWRSKLDKERVNIERAQQATEARARQAEHTAQTLQQRMQEIAMQNADPEQRMALLQAELQSERQGKAELQRQAQAVAQAQRAREFYTGQAWELVREAGMTGDEPELAEVLTEGANAQMLAKLSRTLLQAMRNRIGQAKTDTEIAAQRAKVEALADAGIGRSTAATGHAPPDAERMRKLKEFENFDKSQPRNRRGFLAAEAKRKELGL